MQTPREFTERARRACRYVVGRRARRDAEAELVDSLMSRYEDALAAGRSHDEAVADALAALGDPDTLAPEMEKASRVPLTPKVWGLIALVVIGTMLIFVLLVNLLFLLVQGPF